VVIADDPYSALDPDRRDRVAQQLAAREGQVVISVADAGDVPSAATRVWDVRAGTVKRRAD
jgi:recombinational DNA repair ATPase RecF